MEGSNPEQKWRRGCSTAVCWEKKIHGPTAQATAFNRGGCFGQAYSSPNPFCSSETDFACRCSSEWKGTLLTGNTAGFRLLTWGHFQKVAWHGFGWFHHSYSFGNLCNNSNCAFVIGCLLSLFYHKKYWLYHPTSLTFLWLLLEPSLVQSLKDIMACLRQLLSYRGPLKSSCILLGTYHVLTIYFSLL